MGAYLPTVDPFLDLLGLLQDDRVGVCGTEVFTTFESSAGYSFLSLLPHLVNELFREEFACGIGAALNEPRVVVY